MLRYGLFDLDDTLYDADCGLWAAIGSRIDLFLMQRLGLTPDTVTPLRRRYLAHYGTTLNGLRSEHGVDVDEYLAFVHDLPLAEYLRPSAALDEMLSRLPLTKVVFTNADAAHARRVLACLGISRHFNEIIDIRVLDFVNKPDQRAYARALALLGTQGSECVFCDDAPRNLAPAHALGMLTVLVHPGAGEQPEAADFQIGSILELEDVLATARGAPGLPRAE